MDFRGEATACLVADRDVRVKVRYKAFRNRDGTTRRLQELLAIHGVGPKAIRTLEDEPRAGNLSFRD